MKWTIASRLGIAFAVLLLISAASSIFSIYRFGSFTSELITQLEEHSAKERLATEWANLAFLNSVRTTAILKNSDGAMKEMLAKDLQETSKRVTEIQTKMLGAESSAEAKKLLAEIGKRREVYNRYRNDALQAKTDQSDPDLDRKVEELVIPSMRAYVTSISDLAAFHKKELDQLAPQLQAKSVAARIVLAVLLAVSVLVSVLAGWFLIRRITRSLAVAVSAADRVADGDLTVQVPASSQDEVGQICRSINNVVEHFREVISMVAQNSQQVAAASLELSCAAEEMASGAARVADQAGTVATASEELAATSNEIAINCSAAATGSQQANATAVEGACVVKETVQGMNEIADNVRESAATIGNLGSTSEQIGAIISTINDIADQTNLLALNAAIEAARAGEQGRGFAVVADEVRALAERTSSATREIGAIIKSVQQETSSAMKVMEAGVARVETGTLGAAKSGTALEEILAQISAVTMQVHQIATAAEEQTATTDEISANIRSINDVVQGTARSAQESAASAQQLSQLAEEQQRLVGQFKLE
jgi:methyl-accepting chemotaxis protein